MKFCTLCKAQKPISDFETQRRQCRECRRAYHKVKRADYYARTKTESLSKTKLWREQNVDRKRAYRKSEYAANKQAAQTSASEYRRNNPAKVNAWSRKHQLAKRKRTPNWLSADEFWMMEQAYELAALRTKLFGFVWHVDHVIPLQGELVSGLHTPYNLQVIPARDNQSKSNRFVVS
jgi:hypothetical protein